MVTHAVVTLLTVVDPGTIKLPCSQVHPALPGFAAEPPLCSCWGEDVYLIPHYIQSLHEAERHNTGLAGNLHTEALICILHMIKMLGSLRKCGSVMAGSRSCRIPRPLSQLCSESHLFDRYYLLR